MRRRAVYLFAASLGVFGWIALSAVSVKPASGLRATLTDELHLVPGEVRPYKWRTFWQLDWPAIPAAYAYVVELKTAEGVSRKSFTHHTPGFRLEVAKGEATDPDARPTREVQLQTIQGLLAVRVVPRFSDGTLGAPSAWLEVGRVVP